MSEEYEVIWHEVVKNFKLFLVEISYRTPHVHNDFEICFVLKNSVTVTSESRVLEVAEKDFFIINPCQVHELSSKAGAQILSVQISPLFCKDYFPGLSNISFDFINGRSIVTAEEYNSLFTAASEMAGAYFSRAVGFELKCASALNDILYRLINSMPHKIIGDAEGSDDNRLRRINKYILQNYTGKLMLSDIAEKEGLSLTHLSHLFSKSFKMPFREYITLLRCEKAVQLLKRTSANIIDIAIGCGFSDVKYMNKAFKELFNCTPKQFRQNEERKPLEKQVTSTFSVQKLFTDSESRELINGIEW